MRNAVALIITLLGALLIVSGIARVWAEAILAKRANEAAKRAAEAGPEEMAADAGGGVLGQIADKLETLLRGIQTLPTGERLIVYGIVVLTLGALAAGAVSFNVGASTGT